MSLENESDVDIEGLLEELDDPKPVKTSSVNQQKDHLLKETNGNDPFSRSDGNDSSKPINAKESNAKSVRFQDDGDLQAESIFPKQTPSNLLNNFFLTDDKQVGNSLEDLNDNKNTSNMPKPFNNRAGSSVSKTISNDDWLGIVPSNKQVQEPSASSQSKQRMNDFMSNIDFGLTFDNEPPPPQVMDIGKTPKAFSNTSKPPVPPSSIKPETQFEQKKPQGQPSSRLDAVFENRNYIAPTQRSNSVPKPRVEMEDSPPSSLDLGGIPRQRSTSLTKTKSLVDALPFLLGKQTEQMNKNPGRGESLSPDGGGGFTANVMNNPPPRASMNVSQGGTGTTRTLKKKGVKGSSALIEGGSGGGGGVTLHLPSHLVNEDELKAMSSSLKTLYANQLLLLEQSYQEQLDFFAAQSKRKEDLLKDDLRRMQEDYEQRINRFKAEAENSQFPQINKELTRISSHLEKVSSHMECLQTHAEESPNSLKNTKSTEDLAKTICKEIEAPVMKALGLFEMNVTTKLENFGKDDPSSGMVNDVISQVTSKLDEISNNNQRSAEHILNSQTQLRTILVDSVLGSISKALEQTRVEELRKKDKSNLQWKDLRKDLRRMVSELDGKNDLIHRSHLNVELEQRNISQSIRDINTFLKIINESGSLRRNDSSSSPRDQLATTMQSVQATVQNEMEVKLLREERSALSASIAEVNVERRKLTDEKLSLERDKMEFEREKGRVREMEKVSNSRLAEAENLKRDVEQIRHEEAKRRADSESKRQEFSKEKKKLKERLFEVEQALALKEQKLFAEKSELIREKEFLDKMMEQSLCAGCLKGMGGIGVKGSEQPSQPPLSSNLYSHGRSSGDGLDYGPATKISQILTPNEKAYFLQDNKYLEDLKKMVHFK